MNFEFTGFFDPQLDHKIKKSINLVIRKQIERKDDEIFRSNYRKENGYIPHSKVSRTIITKYGRITYLRRIYKFDSNGKVSYVALVDDFYKVEKKERIHQSLKKEICNKIGFGKRYFDLKDEFSNANISAVSIHNIFKSAKINQLPISKIKLKDDQKLYINIDDCFVNNYKIRPVSFSTGVENHILQQKRITFELKPMFEINKSYYLNRKKLVFWIRNEIDRFYINWQNADLIVAGDGANWITTLAVNLGAKQILSRFHFVQHLRNSFLLINNNNVRFPNFESYSNFKKAVSNFDYDVALQILVDYRDFLISTGKFKTKLRKTIIFINYINSNWLAFTNFSENWNIGCSAESNVFNLVKRVTKHKSFNFHVLNNILLSRANFFNFQQSIKNHAII